MTDQQGEAVTVTDEQLIRLRRLIEQLARDVGYGAVEVVVEKGHVRFFRVHYSIDAVSKEQNNR